MLIVWVDEIVARGRTGVVIPWFEIIQDTFFCHALLTIAIMQTKVVPILDWHNDSTKYVVSYSLVHEVRRMIWMNVIFEQLGQYEEDH